MSNKGETTIQTKLRGHFLTFHTTWGLFSPKEIDEGTRLLIEEIKVEPKMNILDLGCGYGPIGIALAKSLTETSPENKSENLGEIHMIDKDFMAIEYANCNIEENLPASQQKNCQAYLSNGFSHVPEGKLASFDIIVSNIPAKVGKELLQIIMADAYRYLKPGGRFYVVTIAGLREFIKRNFKETFGNYKKLNQSKGYAVAMTEKPSSKNPE
jgi:16S rRNA (guanine1207-N2)-methyltransferase